MNNRLSPKIEKLLSPKQVMAKKSPKTIQRSDADHNLVKLLGGDADADHNQIIGGYIPHPFCLGTPVCMQVTLHFNACIFSSIHVFNSMHVYLVQCVHSIQCMCNAYIFDSIKAYERGQGGTMTPVPMEFRGLMSSRGAHPNDIKK